MGEKLCEVYIQIVATTRRLLTVCAIKFPGEIYSLSALACEQSGIHPSDGNSTC